MALAKCRECGQQVSTSAETCPHCGVKYPYKGKRTAEGAKSAFGSMLRAAGCLGFLFLVGLIYAVVWLNSEGAGTDTEPGAKAHQRSRRSKPDTRPEVTERQQAASRQPESEVDPPASGEPVSRSDRQRTLSEGMTPAEVTELYGEPRRRAESGGFRVWWYPQGLRATFRDGQLAEWERSIPEAEETVEERVAGQGGEQRGQEQRDNGYKLMVIDGHVPEGNATKLRRYRYLVERLATVYQTTETDIADAAVVAQQRLAEGYGRRVPCLALLEWVNSKTPVAPVAIDDEVGYAFLMAIQAHKDP